MKAVCWHGKHDVRVDTMPDPQLCCKQDALIRVTLTGICGFDLHLYHGLIPTMKPGQILGHEFVGEVVEIGSDVTRVVPGDRVVVPFPISCGECWYCKQGLWALCDNSNPNSWMQETLYGAAGAGIFGYPQLYGGYPGGQAELVRVPYADVGLEKIQQGLSDEQVILLTDALPTGYQAAENCRLHTGDIVAVWGCGPVGLLAMKCATHLGAGKVIGIDRFAERLEMARVECGAQVLNYEEHEVLEALRDLTGGRGPDACVDAVGMEASSTGIGAAYDSVKQALKLETDRPTALRQLIHACRKGGTISIAGAYGGLVDKMPMGAIFAKGLTLRAGQTHVQKYLRLLLDLVEQRQLDTSFLITHRLALKDAPFGYRLLKQEPYGCLKIVLNPKPPSQENDAGPQKEGPGSSPSTLLRQA